MCRTLIFSFEQSLEIHCDILGSLSSVFCPNEIWFINLLRFIDYVIYYKRPTIFRTATHFEPLTDPGSFGHLDSPTITYTRRQYWMKDCPVLSSRETRSIHRREWACPYPDPTAVAFPASPRGVGDNAEQVGCLGKIARGLFRALFSARVLQNCLTAP